MPKLLIRFVMVMGLLAWGSSWVKGSYDGPPESNFRVLATVDKIINTDTTNGNPPQILITVNDVISGDLLVGNQYKVFWQNVTDYPAIDRPIIRLFRFIQLNNFSETARLDEWNRTPLRFPFELGAKVILVGRTEYSQYFFDQRIDKNKSFKDSDFINGKTPKQLLDRIRADSYVTPVAGNDLMVLNRLIHNFDFYATLMRRVSESDRQKFEFRGNLLKAEEVRGMICNNFPDQVPLNCKDSFFRQEDFDVVEKSTIMGSTIPPDNYRKVVLRELMKQRLLIDHEKDEGQFTGVVRLLPGKRYDWMEVRGIAVAPWFSWNEFKPFTALRASKLLQEVSAIGASNIDWDVDLLNDIISTVNFESHHCDILGGREGRQINTDRIRENRLKLEEEFKECPKSVNGELFSSSEFKGISSIQTFLDKIRSYGYAPDGLEVDILNNWLKFANLYQYFPKLELPESATELLRRVATLSLAERVRLNRSILETAFPDDCPKAVPHDTQAEAIIAIMQDMDIKDERTEESLVSVIEGKGFVLKGANANEKIYNLMYDNLFQYTLLNESGFTWPLFLTAWEVEGRKKKISSETANAVRSILEKLYPQETPRRQPIVNVYSDRSDEVKTCFTQLDLQGDFSVFAVGATDGQLTGIRMTSPHVREMRQVDMRVNSPDKPVVLMLGGFESIIWNISRTEKTNIVGVLVGGFSSSFLIAGLDKNIPIRIFDNKCDCFTVSPDQGQYLNMVSEILLGRKVDKIFMAEKGQVDVGAPALQGEMFLFVNELIKDKGWFTFEEKKVRKRLFKQ